MQYQTDFICTYKQMDNAFEQDYLYKMQLLQAFDLNTWDDEKVDIIMENTYQKIQDNDVFRHIFEVAKLNEEIKMLTSLMFGLDSLNKESSVDINQLVFKLLFKYDLFDLIHKCLSEELRESRVADSTKELMIKALSFHGNS